MKKILFTVMTACLAFAASAQISQGTILVGASSNLGFTSFNEDAGDYSQFNFDVKAGYFVVDNLVFGLSMGLSTLDAGDFGKETDTHFGAFGRYYFNGKIFGGIGFNSSKVKIEDSSGEEYETKVSVIPIELGYAVFLNDAIALEPALNYSIYGDDGDGASFGFSVGLTVYLRGGGE